MSAKPEEVPEIWPENLEIFELWMALDAQWRPVIGLSRAVLTAPDHSNALAAMIALGVKKRRRKHLLKALCEMQQTALAVLNAAE